MEEDKSTRTLLCPSAQPGMAESKVFGVVTGSVERPYVTYLAEPLEVSDDVLALAQPVDPMLVFRFAAPCASDQCQHFVGERCQLAARVVVNLEEAVEGLPPCRIRVQCRWWRQEGGAACRRCPQVVTKMTYPSEIVHWIADPGSPIERYRPITLE